MKNTIGLCLAIILVCFGCNSQKNVVNKYYVLELPEFSDTMNVDRPTVDQYLEIIPVVVADAYAGQEIVNRNQSNEIIYYAYHHWANRPQASFERMIEKYIDANHVFKDSEMRFWKVSANYSLETVIYHLELIRNGEQLTAHLSLEFNVIEQKTGEKLITHTANRYQDLETKDMNLFAAAVSRLFNEELIELHRKIKRHFSNRQVNSH